MSVPIPSAICLGHRNGWRASRSSDCQYAHSSVHCGIRVRTGGLVGCAFSGCHTVGLIIPSFRLCKSSLRRILSIWYAVSFQSLTLDAKPICAGRLWIDNSFKVRFTTLRPDILLSISTRAPRVSAKVRLLSIAGLVKMGPSSCRGGRIWKLKRARLGSRWTFFLSVNRRRSG